MRNRVLILILVGFGVSVVVYMHSTRIASLSVPVAYEKGLTETSPDGTSCEQSKFSERFLTCVKFDFYEVAGTTRSQVYHQLETNGPSEGHATTVSDITSARDKEGRCMIMVLSRITLPNHEHVEAMSPELQAKWKIALRHLKEHELHHHKIAVEESWREFRNNCDSAANLIARVNTLNKEYDRETLHGTLHSVEF